MPTGIIPPGWRAVLLGSATTVGDLDTFAPLEESAPEGSLMLAQLDFAEYPAIESIDQINQALADAGVTPWPGTSYYAFADPEAPTVYIAWAKGMVWWGVILAILGTILLPPLLMGLVWWILPESVTSLIESMMMFGLMFLLFFLMTQFTRPLMAAEKPKEVKEAEK
jgi:hypothetical protein